MRRLNVLGDLAVTSRPVRRRLVAGAVGAGVLGVGALGAACAPSDVTGGPGKGEPGEALPAGGVTLDVAWENTANLMGQFVTGPAKSRFEERHPGVRLNVLSQAGNLEKLTTLFAAGTPPDVVFLMLAHLAALAERGVPRPLDDLIARDRGFDPRDFQRNMWEASRYAGKTWGIPREGGPTVLYFNRELFQAAGVPVASDFWTWEQWREAAVRLTRPGDEVWGTLLPAWHPFVWSNGGEILNRDLTACVLDAPPAVEGLQYRQDLIHRHQVAPAPQQMGGQTAIQLFMRGKAAMFPGLRSAGNTQGFVQPWVDVALFPQGKTGRWFQMPGNAVGVGAQTKYPQAAWEAAKWLTSTEFQTLHYREGIGGVVARNSTLRSEAYLTSALPRKWNEYFARGQEDLRRWPPTPKWPEVGAVLDEELAALNQGQASARAVAAAAVPRVNAVLRV
jgi:multiple sugar transport system substrate-binding protein